MADGVSAATANPAARDDDEPAAGFSGEYNPMANPKAVMNMNANVCMAALTPQQINDRLALRWSVQVTPVALFAAINLSLAFGSEYLGIAEQTELYKNVFMTVSAAAFSE